MSLFAALELNDIYHNKNKYIRGHNNFKNMNILVLIYLYYFSHL